MIETRLSRRNSAELMKNTTAGMLSELNIPEQKTDRGSTGILVLNCDISENPHSSDIDLLKTHLAEKNNNIVIKNIQKNELPKKSELEKSSGVVIAGYSTNIRDDYNWRKKLTFLLYELASLEIPTLCIGFGLQLVTSEFGGLMQNSDSSSEGFRYVELTSEGKNHFLFKGLPDKFKAYQNSRKKALIVPHNSIILAHNENSLQAFYLRNFYCLQFHPEILPEEAKNIAIKNKQNVKKILNSVENDYSDALQVLMNFAYHCKNL